MENRVSYKVQGLDCLEEITLLEKAMGPEVGRSSMSLRSGFLNLLPEHLAL